MHMCASSPIGLELLNAVLDGPLSDQEKGALGNVRAPSGFTPVHIACNIGRLDIMQTLVGTFFADPGAHDDESGHFYCLTDGDLHN